MKVQVALLATALTATGPALASDRSPLEAMRLPRSAIPYFESPALVANAENASRTLVPADEVSGISQIKALVGHSNLEEQWAFIPAIDLWIEVGKNESASELDSQVEVDTDYLDRIVELYRTVQLFHFHPAAFYQRAWQHEPYDIDFPAAMLDSGKLGPIGYALPSPTDIVSSIELSRQLFTGHPDASFTFAVVSPHGLVTYGPTASGIRAIAYDWGNPRATLARSIVTRLAIRRMAFNIASTIDAFENPTIGQIIEALCLQASDENYSLPFRPL
jgi:hypothetical protein